MILYTGSDRICTYCYMMHCTVLRSHKTSFVYTMGAGFVCAAASGLGTPSEIGPGSLAALSVWSCFRLNAYVVSFATGVSFRGSALAWVRTRTTSS